MLRRDIPDPPWAWGPIGTPTELVTASAGGTRRRIRMTNTPLAVLDLVPISSGSSAAAALRNSIDLAQQAERFGYSRYWFAEHHLNPGVAGTSPAVVLALTAAATSTIRIGSGAVQLGHRTALSTVEEFGLLDAFHPGRLDLGLGRSGGKPSAPVREPVLAGAGPGRRRPDFAMGCSSRPGSRSRRCSDRPGSRFRRPCSRCRTPNHRTTPSRSPTFWR